MSWRDPGIATPTCIPWHRCRPLAAHPVPYRPVHPLLAPLIACRGENAFLQGQDPLGWTAEAPERAQVQLGEPEPAGRMAAAVVELARLSSTSLACPEPHNPLWSHHQHSDYVDSHLL